MLNRQVLLSDICHMPYKLIYCQIVIPLRWDLHPHKFFNPLRNEIGPVNFQTDPKENKFQTHSETPTEHF